MEERESYIRGNIQITFYARAKLSNIEDILKGYRYVHAFDESTIDDERKSREVARLYFVEIPKGNASRFVQNLLRYYPTFIKDAALVSSRLYSQRKFR